MTSKLGSWEEIKCVHRRYASWQILLLLSYVKYVWRIQALYGLFKNSSGIYKLQDNSSSYIFPTLLTQHKLLGDSNIIVVISNSILL